MSVYTNSRENEKRLKRIAGKPPGVRPLLEPGKTPAMNNEKTPQPKASALRQAKLYTWPTAQIIQLCDLSVNTPISPNTTPLKSHHLLILSNHDLKRMWGGF
jgi:hypothetical protein